MSRLLGIGTSETFCRQWFSFSWAPIPPCDQEAQLVRVAAIICTPFTKFRLYSGFMQAISRTPFSRHHISDTNKHSEGLTTTCSYVFLTASALARRLTSVVFLITIVSPFMPLLVLFCLSVADCHVHVWCAVIAALCLRNVAPFFGGALKESA